MRARLMSVGNESAWMVAPISVGLCQVIHFSRRLSSSVSVMPGNPNQGGSGAGKLMRLGAPSGRGTRRFGFSGFSNDSAWSTAVWHPGLWALKK